MHITITGMLGSGKSTICRIIAEEKGYEVYSTGKIQRQVASQKGVTTLELNKMMTEHPELDSIIDNETVRIARENEDKTIIFDSRMAWFFVPDAYNIFLTVDPYISAQRVMRADRGDVEGYSDVEEAKTKLMERASTEHERFIRIYNADYWNYNNYDLILDATWHDPDTLAAIIMGHMNMSIDKNKKKRMTQSVLMSPKSLYPAVLTKNAEEHIINKKDWDSPHVYIIPKSHYNYIVRGHATVLQALSNKTELISVKSINMDEKSQLIIDEQSYKLFEETGEFTYVSNPNV